jgi:hypothetical protein
MFKPAGRSFPRSQEALSCIGGIEVSEWRRMSSVDQKHPPDGSCSHGHGPALLVVCPAPAITPGARVFAVRVPAGDGWPFGDAALVISL